MPGLGARLGQDVLVLAMALGPIVHAHPALQTKSMRAVFVSECFFEHVLSRGVLMRVCDVHVCVRRMRVWVRTWTGCAFAGTCALSALPRDPAPVEPRRHAVLAPPDGAVGSVVDSP